MTAQNWYPCDCHLSQCHAHKLSPLSHAHCHLQFSWCALPLVGVWGTVPHTKSKLTRVRILVGIILQTNNSKQKQKHKQLWALIHDTICTITALLLCTVDADCFTSTMQSVPQGCWTGPRICPSQEEEGSPLAPLHVYKMYVWCAVVCIVHDMTYCVCCQQLPCMSLSHDHKAHPLLTPCMSLSHDHKHLTLQYTLGNIRFAGVGKGWQEEGSKSVADEKSRHKQREMKERHKLKN